MASMLFMDTASKDQSPIVRESVWKRAMRPAGIAAKWVSLCVMFSAFFRVEHASLVQRIEVGVVLSIAFTLLIAVPVYLIAALCYAIGRSRTAEEQFKKFNEAYRVLSDPASRARYNASRAGSSDPAPPGTAQETSPPTNAQQASRPVKPKKYILKILILCIILSGMIAAVAEYKTAPKAGVADKTQQIASLVGSYQRETVSDGEPFRMVQTYYADGTADMFVYSLPQDEHPLAWHFVYQLDGDLLNLTNVSNHGRIECKVIRDSNGRVVKVYNTSSNSEYTRIE